MLGEPGGQHLLWYANRHSSVLGWCISLLLCFLFVFTIKLVLHQSEFQGSSCLCLHGPKWKCQQSKNGSALADARFLGAPVLFQALTQMLPRVPDSNIGTVDDTLAFRLNSHGITGFLTNAVVELVLKITKIFIL